jgi:hypothetical protein
MQRELTAKDYRALFALKYTENTFRRLVIRIAERSAFFPSTWTGSLDKLPYRILASQHHERADGTSREGRCHEALGLRRQDMQAVVTVHAGGCGAMSMV